MIIGALEVTFIYKSASIQRENVNSLETLKISSSCNKD